MEPQQRAEQVRITSEPLCHTHGWICGNVYPTVDRPITVPDRNGQEVYVSSLLRQRDVRLSSSEYELIKPEVSFSCGMCSAVFTPSNPVEFKCPECDSFIQKV